MLLIKGGNVYGKSAGTSDILIMGGKIVRIYENIAETEHMEVLDASGYTVAPGLVDMHVHFRDPGYEYKEDILSGAASAAAGGVTTCCCMPNTSPVIDKKSVVKYVMDKAKQAPIRVIPYGAVTVGQKGISLTDFANLRIAGAIALSDDGNSIQNDEVMRHAMQEAQKDGFLIVSHCEDAELVKNYAVNKGKVSKKLGLPGRPAFAEEVMVAREIRLAAETGARVHIAHVSTAGAVEIIRNAKRTGARITAETCPQYFTLTESEVLRQGALARVNPPLRTGEDVAAVIEGLIDGTIDVIATDHAPHSADEKALPLTDAPSGMIGLETSLALALTFLFHTGKMTLNDITALMSSNPARILGLNAGVFHEDAVADIVIYDPDEEWTVDPTLFKSKARNTPFAGMKLRGKVKYTISRGKIVYRNSEFGIRSSEFG
jgi:dihydroorotase